MNSQVKQNQFTRSLILHLYPQVKSRIENRINEFIKIGQTQNEYVIFKELLFCFLTPQSKAETCLAVIEEDLTKHLILKGTPEEISNTIRCVRFRHTKAKNIVQARNKVLIHKEVNLCNTLFRSENTKKIRQWLVEEFVGIGFKEASHFLRNVGLGKEIAILDRHILRNLVSLGLLSRVPSSLTPKKYLEIEESMRTFSDEVNIPLDHLDLLLWFKETGKILK